ncbi:MAG: peptide chain release factor N(5)-glutamine methyltransferase [Armatimonadetes bacterium]|nr:peptide chain release factor N(5)-glutamine methyltransferase [Armatimonadota bacterium]
MILRDWLMEASDRLNHAGIASAKLEAQLLAGHAMLVDRAWVLSHPEHEVNALALEGLLQRRENGEPLAYILGYREFYGRKFRVDRNVLIPRHETEVLIEKALETENKMLRVLDLGTGSGCIAITLKLERPEWDVWATDISSGALQVARENAETLGAEITFRHSNLFDYLEYEKFDLIVSNPPYIGRDENLPVEVKEFEPETALFADNFGLEIYQKISKDIRCKLEKDGRLLLEIGHLQGKLVSNLFPGSKVHKDLDGNDRVVEWVYADDKA